MAISAKDVMALRQKTGAGMMDCKKALAENDGDIEAAIKFLREKGMARAEKRAGREANEGRVAVLINEDHTAGTMVMINSETDFVARNEEFIGVVSHYVGEAMNIGAEKVENDLIPADAFDQNVLKELSGKIGENLTLNCASYVADANGFIDSYVHPGDQLGVLIVLTGEGVKSDAAKALSHDLVLQIAAASPQFATSDQVPEEVIAKEKEIYAAQMRNEGKPEAIIEKIAMGKLNKFFEEICLVNQVYVKDSKMKVKDRIAEAAKEAGASLEVAKFVRFKIGEGNTEGE